MEQGEEGEQEVEGGQEGEEEKGEDEEEEEGEEEDRQLTDVARLPVNCTSSQNPS